MNMIQTDGLTCFNFLIFSGNLLRNNFNIQILEINQNSLKNNMIIQRLKAFINFDNFNKKLKLDTNNSLSQEEIVIIKKDLFNKIRYKEIMNIINKYIQLLPLDNINEYKQVLPIITNLNEQDIELIKQIFSQIDFNHINKNEILLKPEFLTSPDNKNISVYNNFIVVKKDIIY